MFSDLTGLPLGLDSAKYWDAWTTTHVFYCLGVDGCISSSSVAQGVVPPPPLGWTACSVRLAHSDMGGSTSRRWSFVVWYPPGLPWVEPLTWEPRGGTPLLCCVNDREYARPFLGPQGAGAAGASVVRTGGLVGDSGLFPSSDPLARVIVESSTSPSGYGSHRLMAHELGNLWDMPILFLDSLPETDVGALMGPICASPSSKLLHTGADLLLTAVFRGGRLRRESEKGRKVSARELLGPPGSRPLTDQELRIKWAVPLQDEVSPGGKGPQVEFPPQDDVSTKVSTVTERSPWRSPRRWKSSRATCRKRTMRQCQIISGCGGSSSATETRRARRDIGRPLPCQQEMSERWAPRSPQQDGEGPYPG